VREEGEGGGEGDSLYGYGGMINEGSLLQE
jgi:hypothetical protein